MCGWEGLQTFVKKSEVSRFAVSSIHKYNIALFIIYMLKVLCFLIIFFRVSILVFIENKSIT